MYILLFTPHDRFFFHFFIYGAKVFGPTRVGMDPASGHCIATSKQFLRCIRFSRRDLPFFGPLNRFDVLIDFDLIRPLQDLASLNKLHFLQGRSRELLFQLCTQCSQSMQPRRGVNFLFVRHSHPGHGFKPDIQPLSFSLRRSDVRLHNQSLSGRPIYISAWGAATVATAAPDSSYLNPPVRALCRERRVGISRRVGSMDCLLPIFPKNWPTQSAFQPVHQ